MGLNLKKKLKRAVNSTVNLTVKKPMDIVKSAPRLIKHTIKKPLDFKSAAAVALLNPQIAINTHPKETILGAGAFYAGAVAASGAAGGASAGEAAGALAGASSGIATGGIGAVAAGGAAGGISAGTYLAGATAAAGVAALTAAPAATTTAAAVTGASVVDKVIDKAADFTLETVAMNEMAKRQGGYQAGAQLPQTAAGGNGGILKNITTGQMITAGISLLSLVSIIASR